MTQVVIGMSWSESLRKKEKLIENNSKLENEKRINHEHQITDNAKIVHEQSTRVRPTKLRPPSEVPFQAVEIHNNRAVKMQCGGYRQTILITKIAAFLQKRNRKS